MRYGHAMNTVTLTSKIGEKMSLEFETLEAAHAFMRYAYLSDSLAKIEIQKSVVRENTFTGKNVLTSSRLLQAPQV